MRFTDLDVKNYPRFLALYNELIPANHLHTFVDEKQLETFIAEHKGKFHAFAITDGEGDTDGRFVVNDDTPFLGFISYWTLKGYTYIEHIAFDPDKGHRIASELIDHLIKEAGPDIIAEVEKPDTPSAQELIRIYERHNFRLSEVVKEQLPTYGNNPKKHHNAAEAEIVPIQVMLHGDIHQNVHKDVREMLKQIYIQNH